MGNWSFPSQWEFCLIFCERSNSPAFIKISSCLILLVILQKNFPTLSWFVSRNDKGKYGLCVERVTEWLCEYFIARWGTINKQTNKKSPYMCEIEFLAFFWDNLLQLGIWTSCCHMRPGHRNTGICHKKCKLRQL